MSLLLTLALLLLNSLPVHAQRAPDLTGVAYEQKLGERLPSRSAFVDADGNGVRIGELFNRAPIVLVLGYFHCEKLCGVTRLALLQALREARLTAGSDYVFVAISVDPRETPDAAKRAREIDGAAVAPRGAADGFYYLTGRSEEIHAVADAVGYRYRDGVRPRTFVHPVGAVVATAGGVVSTYLAVIGSSREDVSRAIRSASAQNIALRASPALLLCLDFDPTTGRYTFAVMKLLRIGAIVTVLALAAIIYRGVYKGAQT